ncbi:23859_t:CDS:2, partial [Gigaspora rosea]
SELCGGSCVDCDFLKFLDQQLGFDALKKLKESHYEEFQYSKQMKESQWKIDLEFQDVKNMFDPVVKKVTDLIQSHCASTELNAKWDKHNPPERRTASADLNQTDMTINIFYTKDNNTKYCDEDEVVVEVELSMTFGEMEMKITAIKGSFTSAILNLIALLSVGK